METMRRNDLWITALISRIRAVVLAGLTAAVLATPPQAAQAGATFQFVPDDPAITDVAGFFKISETAFDNRMADTTVMGEVVDFFFEFTEDGVFSTSGSFSLLDLGVGFSYVSFKLTVDPTGEFLSAVVGIESNGDMNPDMFLENAAGDAFGWRPSQLSDQLLINPAATQDEFITGTFVLVSIPEPATLTLFAGGLVGLLGWAWRRRRSSDQGKDKEL